MRRQPKPATQSQHRSKGRKRSRLTAAPSLQAEAQQNVAQQNPDQKTVAPASVCGPAEPTPCLRYERIRISEIYRSFRGGPFYPEPRTADPFGSSPTSPGREPLRTPEEIAATATALLTSTGNLADPAQVNQFLANLLTQLANDKISRKDAMAMACISRLLLNGIAVKHRQDRDVQADQRAADAAKPTQIVIDMPRPNYGAVAESQPSDQAPNNPAPPNIPAPPNNSLPPIDEPPPSYFSKAVPLPRWTEQHFTNGSFHEPQRPNTQGRPRMRCAGARFRSARLS
jgi:hypothetical protein